MRRRRHDRPHDPPPPAAEAEMPRTWRWGQIAAAVWYLGGFAVLVIGVATQTGPYAWMARWQVRSFGGNSVMGAFLPGFGVLLLPFVVLACLPRRADWPFVVGAKDAFWPQGPARRRTAPVAEQRRLMRRASAIVAGLAVASFVAGAVLCALSLRPGEQAPGSPLPRLTLAQVARPGARLPDYASLVGAIAHPEAAWAHDYAIRTTRYHDVFIPLTAPDWRPGDTVDVLQLDNRTVAGDPGPPEGTLARGLPAWLVAAMRDAGLNTADDPVVLTRGRLGGIVPPPDRIDAVIAAIIGGALTMVFAAMAFSFRRAGRRLSPDAGAVAAGR